MQDQVPMNDGAEFEEDREQAVPADEQSVLSEFRSLGEQLVAAVKAAASTPEAESLRADVQDGMRTLRDELDAGLRSVKTTATERRPSGRPANQIRTELAGALRSVNRVLQRAAESMDASTEENGAPTEADEVPATEDE